MIFQNDLTKLIFITGKGGVGKTLYAGCLAMTLAKQGKRVLLVEQTMQSQFASLFGVSSLGHTPTEVVPGLSVANFTLDGNFRDFVVKHLRRGALFEMLAANKVVTSFFRSIPGFGELLFLGRLYYELQLSDRPYDHVIVDSYASGHFLSLMTTPEAVKNSGLIGPVIETTNEVISFLKDRKLTSVVYVTIPEPLAVSEAIEFIPLIQAKSPSKVVRLVINRYLDLSHEEISLIPDNLHLKKYLIHLTKQQDMVKKQLRFFHEDFANDIRLSCVPDFGIVEEPLSVDFVDDFMRREKDFFYL